MHRIVERLRAEYLEMPGLRLTAAQVTRLCGIEPGECLAVLSELVTERFLVRNRDGTYARLTSGSYRPPSVACVPADADREPVLV